MRKRLSDDIYVAIALLIKEDGFRPKTMNRLVKYFSNIKALSPAEIHALEESMEILSFGKGKCVKAAGGMSGDTFFVLKGCVRQYIVKDGEEKTTDIFTEDQWIISSNDPQPDMFPYNLVCMEDSDLVIGNEDKAQKLFEQFPHFESLARTVMEKTYAAQTKLMISNHTDSAEERYLKLLHSRPDIFQRVPQYHIASYLGVQPESLSRIRKRLSALS